MGVEIVECTAVTPEVVAAFGRLIPQLSRSNPPPSSEALAEIASSAATVLLIGRLNGEIVGSLTLALFRIPTGLRAWIEDVVVDESARGMGIGEALSRAALAEAAHRGAKHVSLTSRPAREAANRLYPRLGFELYETNVYRYTI